MKILAIDIGAGTIDILLYVNGKRFENSIKFILPSPTRVYAKKVTHSTEKGRDLHIGGDIIGGGALTSAIKRHLAKNHKVSMTRNSAQSIRNDIDEVKALGIEIKEDSKLTENFKGDRIFLEEISPLLYEDLLRSHEETLLDTDVVAFAVKDHGIGPKGMSSRKFRMTKLEEILRMDSSLQSLSFTESNLPSYFTRMLSGIQASKRQLPNAKVMTMDTSPAAIMGCLIDPTISNQNPIMAVNIGNGHTMAAIIVEDRIQGIIEHHTSMLKPAKLGDMLKDFADGNLTDGEVFMDGGHGVLYLERPPRLDNIGDIVVTGPNRLMIEEAGLRFKYAVPGGDMMMTGPIGLVEATRKLFF
jgi:uncharacterized protein (DUF1786 family)